MINFKCKSCSTPMEAPESLIGKQLDCPNCKQPAFVPYVPTMNSRSKPFSRKANHSNIVSPLEIFAYIFATLLLLGGTFAFFGGLIHDEGYIAGLGLNAMNAGCVTILIASIHSMIRKRK